MRVATLGDIDLIYSMGIKFMEASNYAEYSDPEVVKNVITWHINGDPKERIILVDDNGFLAASVQNFPFGKGKVASETAWWVNEEARKSGLGKELMNAFEYWAKNVAGCSMIVMTSLDESVEKIYVKNGYKLYERAYMKVL